MSELERREQGYDRLGTVLAFAFAMVALALRAPGLGKSIWLDEYYSLHTATQPDFLTSLRYCDHPPLYFVLLRQWSRLVEGEALLRVPALVFGAATVGVMVKWMGRDRMSAVLIGATAVALPLLCDQSMQIRHYTLLTLGTALAFYFANRVATEKDGRGAIGLSLSLCAVVTTHLVGSMVAVSVAAFLLCRGGARRFFDARTVLAITVPAILFCAMYFGFMIKPHEKTAATWWVPPLSIAEAKSAAIEVSGLAVFSQKRLVGLILLPVAIVVAARGDWRRSYPYLVAALVYWGLMTIYSVLALSIMLPRTMLPGMVPLLGFVAVQTASVRPTTLRWSCCGVVVLGAILMARGWWVRDAFREPEPWRTIAAIIRDDWREGSRVVVAPEYAVGPVRFYLHGVPDDAIIPLAGNAVTPIGRSAAGGHRLFLVVRWDATVGKPESGYKDTLARINRALGPPLWQKSAGSLAVSRYENVVVEPST